jgi:hypothetical protein
MTATDEISASDYRKIVLQHSYFLLSRALDSFELNYYNLAVFFGVTAIEEITNNLYNITKKYENFDIVGFMNDFFPFASKLLRKEEVPKEQIDAKLTEIVEKYFKEDTTPLKLSIEQLSSQFKMKEHKSHNKKTLKALIYSLSINPEAYRRLGSGFIEQFLFFAESGLIFKLRNLCLYVNVEKGSISSPEEIIPKSMAVDIIAIAFESIIELKDIGRAYFSKEEALFLEEMKLREKADKFYAQNEIRPIAYVGEITDFLNKKNVIIVNVVNQISSKDDLVIYDSQWKHFDKVLSMEKNHKKITKAVAGDEIGIKIKNRVSRRGLLYMVQKDVGQVQKESTLQLMDLFMETKKAGRTPDLGKIKELLDKSLRGVS